MKSSPDRRLTIPNWPSSLPNPTYRKAHGHGAAHASIELTADGSIEDDICKTPPGYSVSHLTVPAQ